MVNLKDRKPCMWNRLFLGWHVMYQFKRLRDFSIGIHMVGCGTVTIMGDKIPQFWIALPGIDLRFRRFPRETIRN